MNESIVDRLDAEIDALLGLAPEPLSHGVADSSLASLVQAASDLLGKMPVPQPSEAGTRRGRERLLAELDARQKPRGFFLASFFPAWIQPLKRIASPANLALRYAMVASVLAAVILLNGGLAASADSLPGDPLYGLKRIQEQIRLSVTIDDNARAILQGQIDDTRVTELNAIRRLMRAVRTEVSGTVGEINGDVLVVDQLPFTVDHTQFPAVADVIVGDRVRLVVQTYGDGSVVVIAFQREPREKPRNDLLGGSPVPAITPAGIKPGTPTAQRGQNAAPNPAAQPNTQGDSESTSTPSPSATPPPSSTPQASQTREAPKQLTPTPTDEPGATVTPEPSETQRATRTPEPSETQRPTRTPEPSETQRPTRTPEPSETQRPTRTPEPSETQPPTRTLEPSETPRATRTPEPSATQRPRETARPSQIPDPTEARIRPTVETPRTIPTPEP